jgi:hypothetical protein
VFAPLTRQRRPESLKKIHYSNSNVIHNRVEWAYSNRTLWLPRILACLLVIAFICIVLHFKKVSDDKDIAFRSGYAKALHMKKLPKVIY